MRARTALMLVILVALGIFAALNWAVFTAPTALNLVFARVEAPLGVVMLAITVAVTLLYVVFLAWLETAALLEARRSAREIHAQRELAQHAEASRYTELKAFISTELGELRTARESRALELSSRLDRVETELRADIERAGNTLAAYIGELEERLERGDRVSPSSSRPSP
jgi:uncharacterized integral membrane protein